MIKTSRNLRSQNLTWFSAATVTGAVAAFLCVSWTSLCGTSTVSLTGLLTGFVAGVFLSDWAAKRGLLSAFNSQCPTVVVFALSAALLAVIWLSPLLLNASLLAGTETFGPRGTLSSLAALFFPALVVSLVIFTSVVFFHAVNPGPTVPWLRSVLAAGVGVMLPAIHLWLPWSLATSVTLAVVAALSCLWFTYRGRSNPPPAGTPGSAVSELANPAACLHFAAIGMLLTAILRLAAVCLPLSIPVLLISFGLGGPGLWLLTNRHIVKLLTAKGMTLLSLLMLSVCSLLLSQLADGNLWINAHITSPTGLIALRAVQCAALLAAAILPAVLQIDAHRQRVSPLLAVIALSCGLAVGMFLIGRGTSLFLISAIGMCLHLLPAGFAEWLRHRTAITAAFPWRTALSWSLGVLAPVLTCLSPADTTRISSLIFSQRTMAAMQRGVAADLIPQSDANRLLISSAGTSGEISVWQRGGRVVEFRRNGISLGRISTDTNLSPQPAEDVLPAVIALVNHPQPARVLILGDETGACLRSCSAFPLQEIVAIRNDPASTQLASRFTWSSQDTPADRDSRIRILPVPDMLALGNRDLRLFDVVVDASASVSALENSARYTVENYQAIRSRMTASGVFCQRFRREDLGPQPVVELLSTLMSVFRHVGAVQTVPGEILFVATDAADGPMTTDILSRLQRPHVQAEISGIGWDWAQIATLPLLNANDPIGLFSHTSPGQVNNVSNSRFSMTLPLEVVRRADKAEELRSAFEPHQVQILTAVANEEDLQEIGRRLSALTQQAEILAGMPDQPWTYRKSLRMEMQRSPRPPQEIIEDGSVIKVAHPLDTLRKEYFTTLGRALFAVSQSESDAAGRIDALERFANASEPLLSYFSHYEIVRLLEMAKHPDQRHEFRHRLHIVFFTSPSDASVRPVISAMEQLVKAPELVTDPAERYDLMNSLIQKLIERWEARTAWEPRSALRVQNDVDQSVRVTNQTIAQMEVIAGQTGIDRQDFFRRRRFVNAALISPLRDYRDQVLAHRMETETPAEPDSEDPNDMPLLVSPTEGLHTN